MGNVLGDQKVICYEENKNIHKIKQGYIEVLIDVQEDLGFIFSNTLKKKHIMCTKSKMNVLLAAQTLIASVAKANDFL